MRHVPLRHSHVISELHVTRTRQHVMQRWLLVEKPMQQSLIQVVTILHVVRRSLHVITHVINLQAHLIEHLTLQ